MNDVNYASLDAGIRDVVRRVNEAGIVTTDSGDGVSKPRELFEAGYALPIKHVVGTTTVETMVDDAHIMQAALGPEWVVEACYETAHKTAHLFARERVEGQP